MGKLERIEDARSVAKLEQGRTEEVDSSKVSTDITLGTQNPEEVASVKSSLTVKDEGEETETVIVTWNGPDDLENPKNWPSRKKFFNVTIVSMMTFLCPLCSAIFAPGLPQIEADFHTSQMLSAFSVSVLLFGFGGGPLIFAPMSETFGRKPIYTVCFTIFTLSQIGCALSTNIGMLIGFRFVAGLFGSASISNGGGTISDMYDALERTRVIGWYLTGPLMGPVIGPIIGGFMTETLSWRWTFWLMLILSSINTVFCVVFLQETYAPVILARKAAKLQKQSGRPHQPGVYDPRKLSTRIYVAIRRPLRILCLQPIVLIMAVYMAVIYGTLYLLFTTFPVVLQELYGFSPGFTGLTYLGIGIGNILAVAVGIPQIDVQFRRLTAKNNGVSEPEFRLPVANIGAIFIPVSLLWYGWSVQAHTFFLVPVIGTALFGTGTICIFNAVQNYYIDAFTRYAASAIASGVLFRSLVGAVFPLFGGDLYAAIGYGWGCTILAAVNILFLPVPSLIMKYGKIVREKYPIKLD